MSTDRFINDDFMLTNDYACHADLCRILVPTYKRIDLLKCTDISLKK